MQNIYQSNRLILSALSVNDSDFIAELVNTAEWLKFIGERNIKTQEQARDYIQNINANPNVTYWVVKLKEQETAVGIITFIKRDYLEHHDIGFAFLPQYTNKGYAFEAARTVLNDLTDSHIHTHILATTVKENTTSIKLLEKLGLHFETEIQNENRSLLVFSAAVDKLLIDKITDRFFSIFTNTKQQKTDWEEINTVCLSETLIIRKSSDKDEIYNIESFVSPRKIILSDGTLTEFEEKEISEETKIVGNIAQRFSKYQKHGYLNGIYFLGNGNKLFQYIKTGAGWKISSVIWEDESNTA